MRGYALNPLGPSYRGYEVGFKMTCNDWPPCRAALPYKLREAGQTSGRGAALRARMVGSRSAEAPRGTPPSLLPGRPAVREVWLAYYY